MYHAVGRPLVWILELGLSCIHILRVVLCIFNPFYDKWDAGLAATILVGR